ncbi:MAG TPA: MBL fold metallo-hydrolase [Thermomicrobiales bacterium]|nr:MBL fold metallo-hydrolase [Thermomicrobiales bacterium]
MLIEVLGSGGAVPAPRPGCHCAVCDEAREKGVPYARGGPATFIHGANILIDTPEEIREELNRVGIDRVDVCFYSHWHPDHVMGRRVFEALNWDMRGWPPHHDVTDVYLPEQVAIDVDTMLGTGDHLRYMEHVGIIRIHRMTDGESVTFGELTVTPFRLAERYVYAFLVEEGEKRALIAPDELHGWTPPPSLAGVDLAILPMGISEHHPLTGERLMSPDHPVFREEATFAQTLDIVRALQPRQAILSHIEEVDGMGHDDLTELAGKLQEEGLPIRFAYDGMRIDI